MSLREWLAFALDRHEEVERDDAEDMGPVVLPLAGAAALAAALLVAGLHG
jgi:hypothetical protein